MRFASICIAIALTVPLFAVAPIETANGGPADPIVIELGDTTITRADVEHRFAIALQILAKRQGIALADQDPAVVAHLRDQYLDKYAAELVLLREAQRRQLEVDPAQVDRALAELFHDEHDENAFFAEASLGHDADQLLRELLREEETMRLLSEVMLREIKVPPGDVITMHHDVKDHLATPEEVCVRHIQVDTVEAANALRAELAEGADFAALAATRSTDKASAELGGDLGCFERSGSTAHSEFEKAAFAADEGELVGPVASQFGHHLLVVYEHKMPRTPTLNEAYDQIERDIALERLPQRIQALIDQSGISVHKDRFNATGD